MPKTFLCLVMLLAHAPRLAAQTPAPQRPARTADDPAARAPQTNDAAGALQKSDSLQNSDAQRPGAAGDAGQQAVAAALQSAADAARRRDSLLADVRALAEESKELLNPLDAAAAKAEVASAAWTLDREWSKQLLREALALTFPEESSRAKLREHAVGSPLALGSLEDQARGLVRRRVLKIASADPAFARELADTTARELGVVQQVGEYTQLAGDAARAGRLEEASDLILRAADAEPTLMNIGGSIMDLATHDRAAADRLIIQYIQRLRALPVATFIEQRQGFATATLGLRMALMPAAHAFFAGENSAPAAPAGREAFRAYFSFMLDTYGAMEQLQPGSTRGTIRREISFSWQQFNEYAPDLLAQFLQLERSTRAAGATAPVFPPPNPPEADRERYEQRLKDARETKDPLALEVAATSAMTRNDFEEARKLIGMLTDEHLKSQLVEMADEKESVYLTNSGDLAGAARLARQLARPVSIMRAYPPLIRRLAKGGDAASAQFLTYEAAQRVKTSAEKGTDDDTYTPSLLAPVASSIRVFKQPRALAVLSELALAAEPAGGDTALDVLDALVECASKARITSEQGSPNFNAEVFARLSGADDARVRAAASRLEDRLQRVFALAAVYRADAERLNKKREGARPASTPVR
jgi:hypothetical protein